jgi:RNA polymerase sigma-70 factor (ECF subfamily)
MTEEKQLKIFSDWIQQHRTLLFKVVRSYADTSFDQNDLFQEISIQVFRSIPNFRGDSSEVTWLYRIALNTAMKWLTKEKKHTKNHQEVHPNDHVIEFTDDQPYDEKVRWLYDQIKRMDEVAKSLTLLLLDGYSYKEMSEIIGISESNVGVKIHRIKKQLTNNAKSMLSDGI